MRQYAAELASLMCDFVKIRRDEWWLHGRIIISVNCRTWFGDHYSTPCRGFASDMQKPLGFMLNCFLKMQSWKTNLKHHPTTHQWYYQRVTLPTKRTSKFWQESTIKIWTDNKINYQCITNRHQIFLWGYYTLQRKEGRILDTKTCQKFKKQNFFEAKLFPFLSQRVWVRVWLILCLSFDSLPCP